MDLRHNEQQSQYEAVIDGHTAVAGYDLEEPDSIVFTHTEVPKELEGRGVGKQLVKFALDDARRRKLNVVPQCAFVASFIKRNDEYQDLLRK
jgi:uncharacterized protein